MAFGRSAGASGYHSSVFFVDMTGVVVSIDPASVRAVNGLGQNRDSAIEDTDLDLVGGRGT